MSSARLAGWSGVLFVLLSGAVLVLAPFWPPLGAGPTEVVEWYRAHRTPFLIANWLAIAAAVPSFLHLGLLAARIRAGPARAGAQGRVAPPERRRPGASPLRALFT